MDEDEDLNRNLDLEPCQIRQLGVECLRLKPIRHVLRFSYETGKKQL